MSFRRRRDLLRAISILYTCPVQKISQSYLLRNDINNNKGIGTSGTVGTLHLYMFHVFQCSRYGKNSTPCHREVRSDRTEAGRLSISALYSVPQVRTLTGARARGGGGILINIIVIQ